LKKKIEAAERIADYYLKQYQKWSKWARHMKRNLDLDKNKTMDCDKDKPEKKL